MDEVGRSQFAIHRGALRLRVCRGGAQPRFGIRVSRRIRFCRHLPSPPVRRECVQTMLLAGPQMAQADAAETASGPPSLRFGEATGNPSRKDLRPSRDVGLAASGFRTNKGRLALLPTNNPDQHQKPLL
jgi:hypothetical protein